MIDKSIIKSKKPILVKSADTFLTDIFIYELKKEYPERKCKVFTEHESFITEINRGSLFGSEPEVIIYRGIDDDGVQVVAPLMGYQSEDIIALVEQKTLKKVKAYQQLKTFCSYMKIEEATGAKCKKWLMSYMIDLGMSFQSDIPGYLMKLCGNNLSELSSEARKLKMYSKGEDITELMCDEVVSITHGVNRFELVDAFVHKRTKKILNQIELLDKNSLVPITMFILNYLEKLYNVAIYRSQKYNAEEIGNLVGLPKFIVQTKYYTALSIYPKVKILKLLDILNDLDLQLRLSKWDRKMLFEVYILKASRV